MALYLESRFVFVGMIDPSGLRKLLPSLILFVEIHFAIAIALVGKLGVAKHYDRF